MKRLTLAAALAAVACSLVYGQTPDLRADIPFPFHVGTAVLPAGEYIIHNSSNILRVSEESGRASAIVLVNGASRPSATAGGKLVFNRYGDSYFLSRVWMEGSRQGAELRETRQEKELARNSNALQTGTVSVARK